MAKKKTKKIILKRDIVIPKGTIFKCIDGRTTHYANGNYETLIEVTKDNTGFFSVEFDEDNFKYM